MPRNATSSKTRALRLLHARIRECTWCPLHHTRTQAVPGAGPADAEIVFVGEAPGRLEDLQGRPFVGGAGKVLDELLASIGRSRTDVYVTNAVKSRPVVGTPRGRNRPPAREEIAACTPWLVEEIRIIQPKLVVTLGQIALDRFLHRRKLSEVHGKPQSAGGMTILPLYHPAMARYGPTWMAVLKRDFRKIPRISRVQART